MRRIIAAVAVSATALGAASAHAQEQVVIGGAGSMIPVMQELAKAHLARSSSEKVRVIPDSVGSTGGVKATEAGRFAIGLVGRPLKPEEQGRLVWRRLGTMPVVFAVNAGVSVGSLTQAQICAIYGGKVRNWSEVGGSDLRIAALTRNEDDSDKEALRKNVGCFAGLREAPEVIMLTKGSEMSAALGGRPGTLGMTTLPNTAQSQGRYKLLALDGVVPGADTVKAGRYKLVKEFAVVTVGEPRGAAKRFLDFVASADGARILTESGLVLGR